MLFTCEYDNVVWSGAMQWMNMYINTSNWPSILQYVYRHCKRNIDIHQTHIMVLSVTLYMIWKEKNHKRFQNYYESVHQLLYQIKSIFYIKGLRFKKV